MAEVIHDVACTACGCVCDDLTLHIADNQIGAVERGCALGEQWFLRQCKPCNESVQVGGKPADFDVAVERAAEILSESRSPLIYGLSRSSTPGQRAACQLADQLGATIATDASECDVASTLAMQTVGQSTATLGEVRNRADVVVYWGSDPLESHPRHIERFVDAPGMLVPNGRSDRHLVVVDTKQTETAKIADQFLRVPPGSQVDVLRALHAALKGVELHENSIGDVPSDEILNFAARLKAGRYVAMFFGSGIACGEFPQASIEALFSLAKELNNHTRCVVQQMGMPSADNVLCWQTGYPLGVNFSLGYPRYNPSEFNANSLLEAGEVDSVVIVGSKGLCDLSKTAQEKLLQMPTIVLDSPGDELHIKPAVRFTTAVYGIHQPGTAYRMDNVPIPLRVVLDTSLPSDEEVLNAIGRSLVSQ